MPPRFWLDAPASSEIAGGVRPSLLGRTHSPLSGQPCDCTGTGRGASFVGFGQCGPYYFKSVPKCRARPRPPNSGLTAIGQAVFLEQRGLPAPTSHATPGDMTSNRRTYRRHPSRTPGQPESTPSESVSTTCAHLQQTAQTCALSEGLDRYYHLCC